MKRNLVFFAALFFTVLHLKAQNGMTNEERRFAIKYLTETRDDVLKTIKGLSEEQLNFKPNATSWSVAECVRHITISENNIWANFVDTALATEPDASRRSEVKASDEQIIRTVESRDQKVKTFAPFEPENKPEPFKQVVKEFKSLRGEHIKFLKKSQEDLRNRYSQLPFGTTDVYQAIIFMSGHTRRHTDQMKEVMASDNFPK